MTADTSRTGTPQIPDTLASLAVPIADLQPYRTNPRRGNVDLIAESLAAHGQYRPVVANRRTGEVLGGNHTLAAARMLGWEQLAVTWVDVDDEQAARIVLVDNRASDLAEYDDALLAEILEGLPGFDGTGYDQGFLDDLLAKLSDLPPPLPDPDDVPDAPAVPISQPGDVWQIGPHRLICGDSTDVEVLDKVLQGQLADMVWTDPPYGVDYVGGTKDALTIENDGSDGLEELLREALGAAFGACKPGGAWYVAFADKGGSVGPFVTVLSDLGVWRHLIVWVKNSLVLGRGDYHFRHEPIVYGWHPGAPRLHPVEDRKQDTVWEIDRPTSNKDHPTMKPVALIERALENSTDRGWTVLDPFAGSGSTLIACHQTGRVARLVELDPSYVDVICRRYQQGTGTVPVLERTGLPVDFTVEH